MFHILDTQSLSVGITVQVNHTNSRFMHDNTDQGTDMMDFVQPSFHKAIRLSHKHTSLCAGQLMLSTFQIQVPKMAYKKMVINNTLRTNPNRIATFLQGSNRP
jgi:hypothetical protein